MKFDVYEIKEQHCSQMMCQVFLEMNKIPFFKICYMEDSDMKCVGTL